MKTVVIILISIAATAFSTVLVSDDFNDGNADGWIEFPPEATFEVSAGRYCFSSTHSDSAIAVALIADLPDSMSLSDYSCRVNAINTEGALLVIGLRASLLLEAGYALFLNYSDSSIYILRGEGIGGGELLAIVPYSLTLGQEYWIRIEVKGDLIGAKVWTGTTGDEPVSWNLTASDDMLQASGFFTMFGFDRNWGGSATTAVSFDDVVITSETTLGLESNSWAAIKSCFNSY